MKALVAGGADAFERQLLRLYRGGYRHMVVDSGGVSAVARAAIDAMRIASGPRRTFRSAPVSAVLCTAGAGVKSMAWKHPERERP